MNWFANNVKWIFSGIGVAIIGWLLFRIRRKHSVRQEVLNSTDVTQIGGNVSIRESNDRSDSK